MFPLRDLNRTTKVPYVTYLLILVNVAVFAYALRFNDQQTWDFFRQWGTSPTAVFDGGDYKTIVTSMFIHSGWMHIIGNMLFLYIFGDNVEARLGRLKFILFYFIGGLAAFGLQAVTDLSTSVPMVGASGAMSAVLGAYLVFFPHAVIESFFMLGGISRTSARFIILYWFGIQVFFGVSSFAGPEGGIAYFAHIGGFAAGWLIAKAYEQFAGPDNFNTRYR